MLKKLEARGALEKMRKVRQRCGEVFKYAIVTGRAEYNPAPDLASVLASPKKQHFPFLTAQELLFFPERVICLYRQCNHKNSNTNYYAYGSQNVRITLCEMGRYRS